MDSLMERLSWSLWQGFRQSLVLPFLSHMAQHETSLLWVKVIVTFRGAQSPFPVALCLLGKPAFCWGTNNAWPCMYSEPLSVPYLPLKRQTWNFSCSVACMLLRYHNLESTVSEPFAFELMTSVLTNCFFQMWNESCLFSPFPTFFSLSRAPAPPIFFSVLGFQLYLIRSGSKWRLEESRSEMGRRAWPPEAGGTACGNATWREQWLPHSVPTTEDTVRTDHQKCQLSQEIFWIKTPLFRTKGEFLYFLSFVTSVQLLLVDTQLRQIQAYVSAERKYYRSIALNA